MSTQWPAVPGVPEEAQPARLMSDWVRAVEAFNRRDVDATVAALMVSPDMDDWTGFTRLHGLGSIAAAAVAEAWRPLLASNAVGVYTFEVVNGHTGAVLEHASSVDEATTLLVARLTVAALNNDLDMVGELVHAHLTTNFDEPSSARFVLELLRIYCAVTS